MQTRLSLLTLPLVMLLSGCPVWGNDGGGNATGGCRTHGDCSVGDYCDAVSDACTMSNTCTTDAGCIASDHCDYRGTCVPDVAGGCRTDTDCGPTDVCVEGFCRTVGAETCQFDIECGAGQRCVDSACTFECTTAAQCGSGQTCTGGRCVVDATECVTSNDCSGSLHCVEGRCLQDCAGGGGCSDAQDSCSAEDAFCRPHWQQNAFCTGNTDCALGSVCEIATGICRIPCDPASSLITMYNANPNPSCMSATADCACQARNVLLPVCGLPANPDDYCRTSAETVSNCTIHTDCTSGKHCVDGSCL